MTDSGGRPGPRQAKQQIRSLFIRSRFRSRQGYVPGGKAPFEMSKCVLIGIRSQRLLPCKLGVADQFIGPNHQLRLGEVVGQLRCMGLGGGSV